MGNALIADPEFDRGDSRGGSRFDALLPRDREKNEGRADPGAAEAAGRPEPRVDLFELLEPLVEMVEFVARLL